MMGQAVGQQDRLFYEFNLDERVPAGHLLRRINAVLCPASAPMEHLRVIA
jgi:hypothetical protein